MSITKPGPSPFQTQRVRNPCPFCGFDVVELQQAGRAHFAACVRCNAKGPHARTVAAALNRWHERTHTEGDLTCQENDAV